MGLQPDELEMAYCMLASFRGKKLLNLTLLTILGNLFGTPIPNGKLEKVCVFVDGENDASKNAHIKLGLEKTSKNKRYRKSKDQLSPLWSQERVLGAYCF